MLFRASRCQKSFHNLYYNKLKKFWQFYWMQNELSLIIPHQISIVRTYRPSFLLSEGRWKIEKSREVQVKVLVNQNGVLLNCKQSWEKKPRISRRTMSQAIGQKSWWEVFPINWVYYPDLFGDKLNRIVRHTVDLWENFGIFSRLPCVVVVSTHSEKALLLIKAGTFLYGIWI